MLIGEQLVQGVNNALDGILLQPGIQLFHANLMLAALGVFLFTIDSDCAVPQSHCHPATPSSAGALRGALRLRNSFGTEQMGEGYATSRPPLHPLIIERALRHVKDPVPRA